MGRIQRQQWKNKRKGRKVSPEERLRELEAEIGECEERLKTLRVPVRETMEEEKIVRLEPERKIFTDLVRMVAYRAESAMFALLDPALNRNQDEGRAFLQTLPLPTRTAKPSPCASIPCPVSTRRFGNSAKRPHGNATSIPERMCAWSLRNCPVEI